MKRLVLLSLFLTVMAAAEQPMNEARGFTPEKMYDFSQIDAVNMFNGNLNVRIPIGLPLRVNGMLSSQLMLTYNSYLWEYVHIPSVEECDPDIPPRLCTKDQLESWPTNRSNAGFGWMISMGRLFGPSSPENPNGFDFIYESPDGSDHHFFATLHDGDTDDGEHQYTRDSTYARMTVVGPVQRNVELADGTILTFRQLQPSPGVWPISSQSGVWRVTSIADRFANAIQVSYSRSETTDSPYYTEIWTITNGNPATQTTTVKFRRSSDLTSSSHYDTTLDRVETTGGDGQPAVYTFSYQTSSIVPGYGDNCTSCPDRTNNTYALPMLSAVTQPNGIAYAASYDTNANTSGELSALQLPTSGAVSWTWGTAVFSDMSWHHADEAPFPKPARVFSRSFGGGTWNYGEKLSHDQCTFGMKTYISERQKTTWVTAPDATTTIAYYSTFNDPDVEAPCMLADGWYDYEYGLPFTRYASTTVGGRTRFLSRETRTGFTDVVTWIGRKGRMPGVSGEKALRSTWVTYDAEPQLTEHNSRETSNLTYYEDDGSCGGTCYSDANFCSDHCGPAESPYPCTCTFDATRLASFDNYGHFKQASTSGNFPGSGNYQTTFTNYDSSLDSLGHWILGTYTEQCTAVEASERTTDMNSCADLSESALTSKFQFDRSTGALTARRTKVANLADNSSDARNQRDLLAVFTRDSANRGNVVTEAYYGGDVNPLSSTSGFSPGTSTLEYQVDHAYTFSNGVQTGGAMTGSTTKYHGFPFYTEDETFSASTGLLTSSRDESAQQTNYTYDSMGRLKTVSPPGVASTTYTWTESNGTVPKVNSKMTAALAADGAIEREYLFDSFGRLARTKTKMPDDQWSSVVTTYDGLGRKLTVGMPQVLASDTATPTHGMSYSYDPFGRPLVVTQADGTTTTFAYSGTRQLMRTQAIRQSGGSTNSTTTENRDRLGRLIEVDEPSGTSGAQTATTYSYDSGNRLTGVSTGAQSRSLTYDGRGFLIAEGHPEKGGVTAYQKSDTSGSITNGYDSRGHAHAKVEKTASGSIDLAFDLAFEYDGAERLTEVSDASADIGSSSIVRRVRDQRSNDPIPFTAAGRRVMKTFTFGADNSGSDYRLGKLLSATRHNYSRYFGDVPVTESFTYAAPGGRLSRRDLAVGSTTVFPGQTFRTGQSWNDLGLVAATTYPALCSGGDCSTLPVTRLVKNSYHNGLLTSVEGTLGGASQMYANAITYQPNGILARVTHGNNLTDEIWTADPNGMARPCSISLYSRVTSGSNTITDPCGAGPVMWTTGQYSYDGSGNISQIASTAYVYDAVNRIKSAGNETFDYDIYGNITNHTGTSISVDPATNHLSSNATYDTAGNLLTWQNLKFDWDAVGTLRRLNDTTYYPPTTLLPGHVEGTRDAYYFYNADDERVAVAQLPIAEFIFAPFMSITWTLRGFNNELLSTYVWAPGTTTPWQLNWKEDEIWRGSQLLASESPSGTSHHGLDHLGSLRAITNSSGALISQPTFSPFGLGGVLGTTPLQFTAHERDFGGTGEAFDYMHARYYSATLGRFLSADRISVDVEAPQNHDLYAYARNNPLNRVDPDGRADLASLSNSYDSWASTLDDLADSVGTHTPASPTLHSSIDHPLVGTLHQLAATLRIGTATGEAIGRGGDSYDIVVAASSDVGTASRTALVAAEASAALVGSGPKAGSSGGPGAGKDFSRKTKDQAREEAQNKCVFCGKSTTRSPGPDQSNIDHSDPKSRGGNNTLPNAQNTCRDCNLEKSAKTTAEYLEWLQQRLPP